MEKIEKEENYEIEEREEVVENKKKKSILRTIDRIMIFLFLLGTVFVVREFKQSKPIVTNDMLIRYCSDIYKMLSEYPIEDTTYVSEIPKFMSEDITDMFASENPDFVIMYYLNNKESYIMIEKSKDTSTGYEVVVHDATLKYRFVSTTFYDYISMYVDKSNKDIIMTGTTYPNSRKLETIEIDWKNGSYDIVGNEFKATSFDYVDLYGTNQEFDDVRERVNATVIKDGSEFKIYYFGKQIGETITFPGEINIFSYGYILDTNNDLYYLYMNTDEDNPWIKFVKVAENIDKLVDYGSYFYGIKCYNGNTIITYPEYMKNGKTYSAIMNLDTELDYGQNWYGINNGKPEDDVDFEFKTIETDLQKAQTVTFELNYDNVASYSYWYEKFEFANVIPGSIVYKQKRLNGLDTYLTHSIPKEKLEPYVSLKVPVEEEETIKDQLKEIYKQYE